ncbi:RimK family alpha-L-glutamate ligase [Blastopirellula sp. JC732]|uniref:RimK family alpha-L-glutamate ligase n=1 Tax=Blastopirellula sediminis TaxID=2894196 RepID=A0A9X1MM46_9BACT|nr:RimK family alpha-L-glutamate ligase [Blastopirellula sediminis]MCC9608806.1 RimK family alpha-L-glutamate ligase [Blastopirellula sediminis]MCC9628417.1 RimK family alpha-L-glutamate ligase [Blastopirellula sediminis]
MAKPPLQVGLLAAPDSWYAQDLTRAAAKLGEIDVTTVDFRRLQATVGKAAQFSHGDQQNADLLQALLVRTMPLGSLEQVIYRMNWLAEYERQGAVVLNAPRSLEIAIDKYLTLSRLAARGILVPETYLCETWEDALAAYETLGGDVVVKPLFGGEGRGILRVESPDLAERVFKTLSRTDSVLFLQKFVPHDGYDIRVLAIGGKIWGMTRHSVSDWRTNVQRGAESRPHAPTDEQLEIALQSLDALQLDMAGVDLLPGKDGSLYLLEVNGVPGWKALAAACQADIAAETLSHVRAVVESRSSA